MKNAASALDTVDAVLQDQTRKVCGYAECMCSFLAQQPFEFDFVGARRPAREELHDRGDRR
jgi:hypothetical protein